MASSHHAPKTTKSLSSRLLMTFVLLLILVQALIFVLASQTIRNYLASNMDRDLKSSGQVTAARNIEELASGRETQVLPSDFYIYLVYSDADPITVATKSLSEKYGAPANLDQLAATPASDPITVPGTNPNTQWRALSLQLAASNSSEPIGSVVIALPTASINDAVWNLQKVLLPVMALVTVAGGAVAYALIQRSLRGLRHIEKATFEVADGNLSARVPIEMDGSEVASLGESINAMLAQIESSFTAQQQSEQRMRQFVSDASHELRTPLATVSGYAELYRIGGVPSAEVSHAMSRIESESKRMASLVEDLLQLARLDEGHRLHLMNVDLASIALNTVSDFLARAPERQAQVTNLSGGDIESVIVAADQDKVTQVVSNLLSNVLAHTPADTAVEVAVGTHPYRPGEAVMEIRDHGPGISKEDSARIFERFYRTDASRSRISGGSGLGLAIVSAIMAAHGGTARTLETSGGGLTVRLTFPHYVETPEPQPSHQRIERPVQSSELVGAHMTDPADPSIDPSDTSSGDVRFSRNPLARILRRSAD